MTDAASHTTSRDGAKRGFSLSRLPKPSVWLITAAVFALIAVFDAQGLAPALRETADSLLGTAPFILFAVGAVAFLKATGAETLLARAFTGPPVRMIALAALMGGLAPFCSCEVIPFVAAMLALGAPLGAVMAFWLASPLMDPAMFSITWAALGLDFAIFKTAAAVGIGLAGGYATQAFAASPVFADPLKTREATGGCCGSRQPFSGAPVWRFWSEAERRDTFREQAVENALFLFKWLALAYALQSVMIAYAPADAIAGVLGGDGPGTIALAALVGAPAYLNGYAAAPLLSGLMEQGMGGGAAMAFAIAGGISCIPASMAVWALVKPRVFAAYIGFAFVGSIAAGLIFAAL